MKHWVKKTIDEIIGSDVVKMVANNAFMIEEMKQKVRKETIKEIEKILNRVYEEAVH